MTRCLPPRMPKADMRRMCHWFGCRWEFTRECCWLKAACGRCGRVGLSERIRSQCEKSVKVYL
jgi:hypothetical protein